MKQLPEKWAIRPDDPEFYDWLNANKKDADIFADIEWLSDRFVHLPHYDLQYSTWSGHATVLEGYEEINIEQWREAVKQYDQVEILKSVLTNTPKEEMDKIFNDVKQSLKPEETGELIGYEAPFDMYGDQIKKGEKKRVPKSGWVIESIKKEYASTCFLQDKDGVIIFPSKLEAIKHVIEHAHRNILYTYHEVDYITEE